MGIERRCAPDGSDCLSACELKRIEPVMRTSPILPAFIRPCEYQTMPGFDGIIVRCDYDSAEFLRSDFALSGISLPGALHNALPRRLASFLAGRVCARLALAVLGWPVGGSDGVPDCVPQFGKDGQPVWPDAVHGSISHTATVAVCAVQWRGEHRGLGIDVENCMADQTARETAYLLADAKELALLQNQPVAFEWALSCLFSAKESLYKALFPTVGRYFDFLDAELMLIDWETGQFSLRLKTDLHPACRAGQVYSGQFIQWQSELLTLLHA